VQPESNAAPVAFALMDSFEHADEDLWVFAYGSLMWRPGFAHVARAPARLIGLHRALCVYSFVHRGTPEKPGLVLGLDRGGACRGIVYRVERALRAQTIAYLRAREQVTMVYREAWRDVLVAGASERRVRALVYIVDRGHPQYAGRLDLDQQLHFVRQGHGSSGANPEYVLATVAEIEAQGIRDTDLHRLAERLKGHDTRHGLNSPSLKP
jgi:glutathione-specific gamma-glutamylcyclotransferase